MAKDPVLPLYYNDLDRATRDWTDEEFGAYVRLLMHQWDKGFLPKDYQRLTRIATSLATTWPTIKEKFIETEEGLQNSRMEEIRLKRKVFKEKQTEKVRKRYQTSTNGLPNSYQTSTEPPTENLPIEKEIEKEKEIEEGGVGEKLSDVGIVPEMIKEFKKRFPEYFFEPEKDYPACLQIAYKIGKMNSWNKHTVVHEKVGEVTRRWGEIVDFIASDKWFSKRSLTDINSEWQRLIQGFKKDYVPPKLLPDNNLPGFMKTLKT